MAFFPRSLYNTEATSFTPLFRLLDDFDNYSRQSQTTSRKSCVPQWQPKFDVRETEDAYELHGELPGVDKENVHIEFSDPQTMVVRGKVERSYTEATPSADSIEAAESYVTVTEGGEKPSHQASVADEDEMEVQDSGSQQVATPATSEPEKPVDKAKYWLTERSIGEFARSFNFPTRVEQEEVSAGFKNGILTVVVPKAKKHESRRISIN